MKKLLVILSLVGTSYGVNSQSLNYIGPSYIGTTGIQPDGIGIGSLPVMDCSNICGSVNSTNEKEEVLHELLVYPNPTSSELWVETHRSSMRSLSVYNLSGKEVLRLENVSGQRWSIDVSNWSPGIYLIRKNGGREGGKAIFVKQ